MTIALATSSDREDLAAYGKLVGMDDLIDEASSSADAKDSKPEPDIFAAALRKVGMQASQAIALGDTPWEAKAAGKLGITVIGVTCGGWKADDLRDAAAWRSGTTPQPFCSISSDQFSEKANPNGCFPRAATGSS